MSYDLSRYDLTDDELSQVVAFMHELGGKVTGQSSRRRFNFHVGESWYVIEKEIPGHSWERKRPWFTISGTYIPQMGNRRGTGKLRRKSLTDLLDASRPYVRTKNAHETALEASRNARDKWRLGYRDTSAVRPLSPLADAYLLHAYVMGEPGGQTLVDERLAALDAWALEQAASEGILEMWNQFDQSLR